MSDLSGFFVIPGCDPDELAAVLADLRPEDKAELMSWGHDPSVAEVAAHAPQPWTWTVLRGDAPVFVFGLVNTSPGVFSLWGFGTPRVRRVLPAFTRWLRDDLIPHLARDRGVCRVEVRVPLSARHSWPWLQAVGFRIEVSVQGIGSEPFLQLAYTKSMFDVLHQDAEACSRSGNADEDQR